MSFTDENGSITDPYRGFIAKSRYARWLPEENRRETWTETVDRYIDFMKGHVEKNYSSLEVSEELWAQTREFILNHKVMPSMRALMTAGPAMERSNVAAYNCSFMPVDSLKSFDEALYILMNGTGLGFSVEQQYVSQLPVMPNSFEHSSDVIRVADSKEGWARAYRQLIHLLIQGKIPSIDITDLRPAGARLKTFGGRSSGPQPLVDLFDFTIKIFMQAAGRQMTDIEVHDVMCKIGDVVVVGGVRRSALISMSDLSSYEMAHAKSGAWWDSTPWRRLANNSAVYYDKPSIGEFLREWTNLYESKSGERGIINMVDLKSDRYAPRRKTGFIGGLNPCGEIKLRPYQFCNLTEVIIEPEDTPDTLVEKVGIATFLGTLQSSFTNFKYLRKIWKDNCEEERLLGVSLTGQFGSELMSGKLGQWALEQTLKRMREAAIQTNATIADAMGINHSTAITTVKPSGTVSQLTATSSGMHPWHNDYYIRSVRQDNKDPLTAFMKFQGVPSEPDIRDPENTTVFYFPQKAPEGAVTRLELTAIDHLEFWKAYKVNWTEHNPSVTINVREHEWIDVANWVYNNWDYVGGISFLPYDGGTYKQAPYQDTDESGYNQFLADMPKEIDWNMLELFEFEDNTSGSQTLACTSSACEIVGSAT